MIRSAIAREAQSCRALKRRYLNAYNVVLAAVLWFTFNDDDSDPDEQREVGCLVLDHLVDVERFATRDIVRLIKDVATVSFGVATQVVDLVMDIRTPEGVACFFDDVRSLLRHDMLQEEEGSIQRDSVLGRFLRRLLLTYDQALFDVLNRLYIELLTLARRLADVPGLPGNHQEPDQSAGEGETVGEGESGGRAPCPAAGWSQCVTQEEGELYIHHLTEQLQAGREVSQAEMSELEATFSHAPAIHYLRYQHALEHREYEKALESLHRYFDVRVFSPSAASHRGQVVSSGVASYGLLNLASCELHFRHYDNASLCMREAIRIAHQNNEDHILINATSALNTMRPQLPASRGPTYTTAPDAALQLCSTVSAELVHHLYCRHQLMFAQALMQNCFAPAPVAMSAQHFDPARGTGGRGGRRRREGQSRGVWGELAGNPHRVWRAACNCVVAAHAALDTMGGNPPGSGAGRGIPRGPWSATRPPLSGADGAGRGAVTSVGRGFSPQSWARAVHDIHSAAVLTASGFFSHISCHALSALHLEVIGGHHGLDPEPPVVSSTLARDSSGSHDLPPIMGISDAAPDVDEPPPPPQPHWLAGGSPYNTHPGQLLEASCLRALQMYTVGGDYEACLRCLAAVLPPQVPTHVVRRHPLFAHVAFYVMALHAIHRGDTASAHLRLQYLQDLPDWPSHHSGACTPHRQLDTCYAHALLWYYTGQSQRAYDSIRFCLDTGGWCQLQAETVRFQLLLCRVVAQIPGTALGVQPVLQAIALARALAHTPYVISSYLRLTEILLRSNDVDRAARVLSFVRSTYFSRMTRVQQAETYVLTAQVYLTRGVPLRDVPDDADDDDDGAMSMDSDDNSPLMLSEADSLEEADLEDDAFVVMDGEEACGSGLVALEQADRLYAELEFLHELAEVRHLWACTLHRLQRYEEAEEVSRKFLDVHATLTHKANPTRVPSPSLRSDDALAAVAAEVALFHS